MILLLIAAAVSYSKNEIFAPITYVSSGTGIKRMYYGIVNNTLIFFTTVIYLARYLKELNIHEYIKLLLVTSVVLGLLRIGIYFLNFHSHS